MIVNYVIDGFFLMDILINFRTTIIKEENGIEEEITETREIAIGYLKGRFILDLVSSIPYDALIGNSNGEKLSF